jgi:hypothetical protein
VYYRNPHCIMADKEDIRKVVDDTPISPSRPNPGRKNSLEYHLSHRPDRHELVESMGPPVPELVLYMYKADSAPSLQRTSSLRQPPHQVCWRLRRM